ncbi:MAG: tetratricopeptide repeat protein [Methanospirillum sp.]|uniref:chemotaxis protein CheC n=1 Tax=Methanospirillum sp. TaxID=45200 RepID=UPI00236B9DDA|nr:tetratricopeptide repeat protein [Methanospirillum sp.]MDD1727446.1 tetratricopeptide repeat protein [Methanospirillum sp.]
MNKDTAKGRELKSLLRRGEDALLRRDYERASTYFRRAYTTDPGNIIAITNLGYVYAKMGRFSHAQKCFITALDIDPDNQVAKKNLSLLMSPDKGTRPGSSGQGRGGPGEELFLRYLEWGNLQMKQGNYYAAIQYFKQASSIHPDFIEPHIKIGLSYEELKEYASAVGAFTDALDIFPKDPVAQEHLDQCRGMSNDSRYLESEDRESKTRVRSPPTDDIHDVRQEEKEHIPVPAPKSADHIVNTPNAVSSTGAGSEGRTESDKPKTDDDVIRSILDQYSDLMGTAKPSEKELPVDSPQPEAEIPELKTPEPPQAPVSVPGKSPSLGSDDIVNSILMQYQDDIAGESDSAQPEQPQAEQDQIPYTGQAPLSGENNQMTAVKPSGIRVDLNENQKDALRELGNIGASHAATTLSTMLNTPIMLNVPEISITDFEHINKEIIQENSAMGIFTMEGQMAKAGYVILHVPRESVVLMTSIMLGMPVDPSRELNEMDESAITEIGNIMVSAFLDGTAELLGIIMLPSPPRTIFDLPKNVFDLIIKESNILYDNVVFFKTELICDEHELNLNIFMLPNPPVLQEIVRMLEKIIEDSAQGQ